LTSAHAAGSLSRQPALRAKLHARLSGVRYSSETPDTSISTGANARRATFSFTSKILGQILGRILADLQVCQLRRKLDDARERTAGPD
jgi:hypothetical protein